MTVRLCVFNCFSNTKLGNSIKPVPGNYVFLAFTWLVCLFMFVNIVFRNTSIWNCVCWKWWHVERLKNVILYLRCTEGFAVFPYYSLWNPPSQLSTLHNLSNRKFPRLRSHGSLSTLGLLMLSFDQACLLRFSSVEQFRMILALSSYYHFNKSRWQRGRPGFYVVSV